MNRLQKKCMIASLALHALLCVILLVGPAFLSSNHEGVDQPTLEVIPAKIVDSLFSGGGNPKANPPAAQRVVEPPPPAQTETRPPDPTPKPPQIKEQERKPAVEKIKPPQEIVENPAPQKPEIKVSTTVVKRTSEKDKEEKARAETEAKAKAQAEAKARVKADADARRRAAQQLESRLNSAYESLSKNLSSGTTIEPLGPGGEPYADYGQVVKSCYDQAWIDPEDVSEDAATVKVKVVIRRDGTVILDSIQKRAGIPALDKSVQNALDRVRIRGLPPFPNGAKESQRIYIINFNLKAKRLVG
jgi:outer membrane biosynthesis protein TonB